MSLPLASLKPPTGTTPQARRIFAVVADGLAARGDLYAEDVFTIRDYATCVAEAALALEAGRKVRNVPGYNGQLVANPNFGEARAWMALARGFADDLGLSPGARAKWQRKGKGGRPKGAASAPDRAARRRQLTVLEGAG